MPVCAEIFDETLGDRPNQLDVLRDDVRVTAADLLAVDRTPGERTEQGLRGNIRIGIQYLQAWLSGNGAAGINNLMEDAATAEISRSQVWQWMLNDATLDTGETVTRELVERIVEEEYAALRDASAPRRSTPATGTRPGACSSSSALSEEFPDFLTLPAYRRRPRRRTLTRAREGQRGHVGLRCGVDRAGTRCGDDLRKPGVSASVTASDAVASRPMLTDVGRYDARMPAMIAPTDWPIIMPFIASPKVWPRLFVPGRPQQPVLERQ